MGGGDAIRRTFLWVPVIFGIVALVILSLPKPESPSGVGHLRVEEGFQVELAAGIPLVMRPITADFDELGRLYVAESSGSNDKVEVQLAEKPHRIIRLEDLDGDGVFDRRTIFADRMMLPQGTLWFDGSLYVAAPPVIWKLTDTTGDGIADRREEWFVGETLTQCANDLHGPYLGPDGWIYWCKGAFGEQSYERPGKAPFVTRAAHVFRRHPEDTLVEPVLTGGMDNPVDVDFTPEGERILTATFFEHPQLGRRDALIHAIYGGVYGKHHDVLDGHPRTGELMSNLTHYGPAAPAGLTRYASDAFGEEYRDNFFAALFNLNKVTRHILEPKGATFAVTDIDFLVSSDPDFHPTDVIEDADGSLLVVDTGGWYKLCCPTSQLHKPDVLGGIYRIRKRASPVYDDPRGLAISWESLGPAELGALLDDSRPSVRRRAIETFSGLGESAVPALIKVLETSDSVQSRRNAVWTLTRIRSPQARHGVQLAMEDPAAGVRQAAAHSAALWSDRAAASSLRGMLNDESLQVRRVAAEALGRIGEPSSVSDLLTAVALTTDRILEHSLIYALVEINDPASTVRGLSASASGTRRAALIAMDQMETGRLRVADVVPFLTDADPSLQETAWWIAGNHPEWGGELASFLSDRYLTRPPSPEEREIVETRLAQFAAAPAIQELLAQTVQSSDSRRIRLMALRIMSRSLLKEMPEGWLSVLEKLLSGNDQEILTQALAVVRVLPVPGPSIKRLEDPLLRLSRDPGQSTSIRLEALAAIPTGLSHLDSETFDFLAAGLDSSQPFPVRARASNVLERATLTKEQLFELADLLQIVGPLELSRLISAFSQSDDEEVGMRLIESLAQSQSLTSLHPELLASVLASYPQILLSESEGLLALLERDTAKQRENLERLFSALEQGDIRRGQVVFNGEKAACITCHSIGYKGGKLGPDLTRIGEIRTRRDLLEAIVYPDASFVRNYEPFLVATVGGVLHSGIIRRETPEEIILAVGADMEIRIPRVEISEIRPGSVSLMPSGLDQQLTRRELADLLAFLEAARR